jgi:hypothetical protein
MLQADKNMGPILIHIVACLQYGTRLLPMLLPAYNKARAFIDSAGAPVSEWPCGRPILGRDGAGAARALSVLRRLRALLPSLLQAADWNKAHYARARALLRTLLSILRY